MPSKLERKFGKYAIPNLTLYLIIGYGIGYIVNLVNADIYELLLFDPYKIFHGQLWRLLTWVLTMPESLGIFTIIMLFLYYSLGSSLEGTWGTFRYNLYLFSGFLFTIAGAIILYLAMTVYYSEAAYGILYSSVIGQTIGEYISYFVSTYYINLSIFLAFAVTYPDMQLMLYFIIPVKIKWFGFVYGGFLIYDIISAFMEYPTFLAIINLVVIFLSLLNFLIYWLSGNIQGAGQIRRKRQYTQSIKRAEKENVYQGGARHRCAVCGRTELDDPNLTFRYCSKCSGSREYCQDHLFTHTHK